MLDIRFAVELFFFYFLIIMNVFIQKKKFPFFQKTKEEWFIDILSLLIQGFFIPLVGAVLWAKILFFCFPQFKGAWNIPFWASFLLAFVFVDYIYYWSHRILHHKKLWHFHIVHHSASEMDVINTSRNSIITHFILPYIWLNGLFIYLLTEPAGYVIAFSITAIMDLWRHSKLYPEKTNHPLWKLFEFIFITPRTHSWHHSTNEFRHFFAANFALWDRLHGTYKSEVDTKFPTRMGIKINRDLSTLLLKPHRIFKKNTAKEFIP